MAQSQAEADFNAHALACKRAKVNKICISTATLPGVCIDSHYSQTLKAVGGTPWVVTPENIARIPIIHCDGVNFGSTFPYVWEIVAGSLPPGLELRPCSGVIDGTPTAHGVYTFTVKATDQNGGHQQKELSICVVEITTGVPPDPILGPLLPDATIGAAYSVALNQEPGSAPTEKWTLISGILPAGLTLDLDGTLHGTPTGPAQSVNLVIQVEVDCS